jgi:trimeric autotransporter adhesin
VVTNAGNVTLATVSVNDPTLGAVTCPTPAAPGLAPGASVTCTANVAHTVTQADVDAGKVTDTATATGTTPDGTKSPVSAPSTVTIPATPGVPTVSIVKTATVSPVADQGGAKLGDTISFSYLVTNTGNVTDKSVAVSDPTGGAVTCPAPAAPGLAPGASVTCTANVAHTVTQADVTAGKVTDTATATGLDVQGVTSPPSAPSTVTVPVVAPAATAAVTPTASAASAAPAATTPAPDGLGAIGTDLGQWLPGSSGQATSEAAGFLGLAAIGCIGLAVTRRRRRRKD